MFGNLCIHIQQLSLSVFLNSCSCCCCSYESIKDIFYVMDSIEANKVDIPKPEHQEEDSPTCIARTKGKLFESIRCNFGVIS